MVVNAHAGGALASWVVEEPQVIFLRLQSQACGEQNGRVVGLSPVALGVLWAAGGLGGRDIYESQSSGVMMCISLVSRENEQVEMAVGPLPLIHS